MLDDSVSIGSPFGVELVIAIGLDFRGPNF